MKYLYSLLCLLLCNSVSAEIQLPALFSDGMVLQQNATVPVWGWAPEGTQVKVIFGDQSKTATATSDGKWMLSLDPLKASAKAAIFSVTVGSETKAIQNVLVGEVWLCSGQSNMDFTMGALSRPARNKVYQPIADALVKEIAQANDPLFRQIAVAHRTSAFEEQEKFQAKWIESSPKTNAQFTATGYFFGRQLRKELGVPVALIKCAWGGTLVQPWIPMQSYQETDALKSYYEEQTTNVKKRLNTWDPEKTKVKNKKIMDEWKEKVKEAKEKKKKKPRRPRLVQKPDSSNRIPSTLYNGMIHTLVPYAIKGAIWYQGESNAKHLPDLYSEHFSTLIKSWRRVWKQGDFPFYYAQLANFSKVSQTPLDKDDWATVCNQQRLTLKLKNTGMAVLNDIGESEDIHPKNKIDVGKRLALWALAKNYDKNIIYSGPLYKNCTFKDTTVTVTFDSVGQGLMVGKKVLLNAATEVQAPLKGFQVCGEDRVWKWADAKITAKDQVEISHPEVKIPVEVRYAWAKNAEGANLYNKDGLPTSIFKATK